MTNQESIDALRQEKGFWGTGFNAKNIVNAVAACDDLTGLHLFPGLQSDNAVVGPNPNFLLDLLYDPEIVGSYGAQLKRLASRATQLSPSKILHRGVDVTEKIREACLKWKWVQLNMCKHLQVEEVRLQGLYGGHRRCPRKSGPPAVPEEEPEEDIV